MLKVANQQLRGNCIFKKTPIQTNSKLHCITTKGVNRWNNCNNELKYCATLSKLKQLFRNQILNGSEQDL